MIDPLTNSMNQVSEEGKRRKRKAELQAQMGELEAYDPEIKTRGIPRLPLGAPDTASSAYKYAQLKKQYDSLDY